MDSYHIIYLQWMLTITSTYNELLPRHLLTIDRYHNIYLQRTVSKTHTYNGWLP